VAGCFEYGVETFDNIKDEAFIDQPSCYQIGRQGDGLYVTVLPSALKSHVYSKCKVPVRLHDRPNYRTDRSKTDIFRKLMIQH
jgi:hypothetical protein